MIERIYVAGSYLPKNCNLHDASRIAQHNVDKAIEIGATAIISGGIKDKDLMDFLGYEIGVAITGKEDIPITIIITEGFGKIAMSHRSFSLLKDFEGYNISANGETQIRAGVMRPEIIIPHTFKGDQQERDPSLPGVRTDCHIAGVGLRRGRLGLSDQQQPRPGRNAEDCRSIGGLHRCNRRQWGDGPHDGSGVIIHPKAEEKGA